MRERRVIDQLLEPEAIKWLNAATHITESITAHRVASAIMIATDQRVGASVDGRTVYVQVPSGQLVKVWAGGHWVPVKARHG